MKDLNQFLIRKYYNQSLSPFYIALPDQKAPKSSRILLHWAQNWLASLKEGAAQHSRGDIPKPPLNSDILLIKKEEAKANSPYSLQEFEELFQFIRLKAHKNQMRLIVIDQAHLINHRLANKLLVTFEEPPPFTSFILLNPLRSQLLPTLLSRSIQIVIPLNSLGEHHSHKINLGDITSFHKSTESYIQNQYPHYEQFFNFWKTLWSELATPAKSSFPWPSFKMPSDAWINEILPSVIFEWHSAAPKLPYPLKTEALQLFKTNQDSVVLGLSRQTRYFRLIEHMKKVHKLVEEKKCIS